MVPRRRRAYHCTRVAHGAVLELLVGVVPGKARVRRYKGRTGLRGTVPKTSVREHDGCPRVCAPRRRSRPRDGGAPLPPVEEDSSAGDSDADEAGLEAARQLARRLPRTFAPVGVAAHVSLIGRQELGDLASLAGLPSQGFEEPPQKPARKREEEEEARPPAAPAGSFFGAVMRTGVPRVVRVTMALCSKFVLPRYATGPRRRWAQIALDRVAPPNTRRAIRSMLARFAAPSPSVGAQSSASSFAQRRTARRRARRRAVRSASGGSKRSVATASRRSTSVALVDEASACRRVALGWPDRARGVFLLGRRTRRANRARKGSVGRGSSTWPRSAASGQMKRLLGRVLLMPVVPPRRGRTGAFARGFG